MSEGAVLARLLRKIAVTVEKMDNSEVALFIEELKAPTHRNGSKSNGRKNARSQAKIDQFEMERILDDLRLANDRRTGLEILDSRSLLRKELEKMARLRNVHVVKEDSVSRIKEKIVDAMVGSRLGSMAIRGEQ